jgi:UDP-2,3-diacylglucosamine pyrophosphatase LpxH
VIEKKYKTIFISDVHLGTRDCKADQLNNFLKNNTCETMYLVGDIIDAWKIQQNRWRWRQSHSNVIRRILGHAKRDTRIIYIAGNHDEFLRPLIPYGIGFGHIEITNQSEHVGIDGKRYLVIHGDFFDALMHDKKWLMHIGDTLYDIMIWVNIHFNKVRKLLGRDYWSLSKYLKQNTKQALNFVTRYEQHLAEYCKQHDYDGIICGHIHTAEMREIDGVMYMNDGDWVESSTALVEHLDSRWEIIHYDQKGITEK